ncbi:DUF2291 family protein [Neoasaia chiangmaiensis]|nr:DUF2291 domain-containing protein [Neoasaia chiangmaiensis]
MMKSPLRRGVVIAIPAIALLVAMGLSTHFVRIGASSGGAVAFSPETFGKTEFPKIQAEVVRKAVDAPVFAKAVMADKDKAASQYGVPGNIGPEISVKFTGTAGTPVSGVYPVTVPGLPDDIHVRVQTGPAINGTDLRDATGTVTFGQFTNQIDYQNAGAALNKEMKTQVLSKIDTKNLAGKNVTVVGVFQLINPKNWLVTPVQVGTP